MGVTMRVGFGKLGKQIADRIGADRKAIGRAIYIATKEWGEQVVQEMIATTPPHTYPTGRQLGKPVDTGSYASSWKTAAIDGGAILYSNAKHASIVERGRRPGFVSYKILIPWVVSKVLTFRKGKRANREKQAVGIAIAIAKTLSKRAIPGRWVRQRTHADLFKVRPQLFLAEIRRNIKRAK